MKIRWKQYGLAIAVVSIAFALREGLNPLVGRHGSFSLFLIATYVACRYGGTRPAVLALLLGIVPAVFQRHDGTFDQIDFSVSGFYLALGAIIISLERWQRSTEEQLRAFMDNAAAVIYIKDREGRLRLVNRHFEELFHVSNSEVAGRTDFDIFPQTTARAFQVSDRRVFETGEVIESEEAVPHADGLHTYKSIKFPIRGLDGQVVAIGGISTDISQEKRTWEELQAERELLQNLINKQEAANKIICYEIHDGIIQSTTAALMMLEGYRNRSMAAGTTEAVDKIVAVLRRAVKEGRQVLRGLRPTILDDAGIDAALYELVEGFEAEGLQVQFVSEGAFHDLPELIETTVYRVIQESLTNARKHSRADKVLVRLERANEHIALQVRDFGVGFDVDKCPAGSLGLRGIRERVRLTGGSCSIESRPGSGTTVWARFPTLLS